MSLVNCHPAYLSSVWCCVLGDSSNSRAEIPPLLMGWAGGHKIQVVRAFFLNPSHIPFIGFPCHSFSKESACNAGDLRFDPWVGKIPWRRKWQPTPVFLPGESHGQRTWRAIVHGVARVGQDLATKPPPPLICLPLITFHWTIIEIF